MADTGMACDGSQRGQAWVDPGEGEWAAPAKVWRGGDCKGGNCADKQRGPEKCREKLRKKFGRAGTPPSLFSQIFFIPSLPLGSPSFLSHFS